MGCCILISVIFGIAIAAKSRLPGKPSNQAIQWRPQNKHINNIENP